jgi:hypothetical protein
MSRWNGIAETLWGGTGARRKLGRPIVLLALR